MMIADLSPRSLRTCLGRFATGIAVVTATGRDGEPVGLTINSFTAISLEPPLILFSLDRATTSLPDFEAGEAYAVNVLSADQQGISDTFARADPAERWRDTVWSPGSTSGAPVLEGAIARFECVRFAVHDGGDHRMFLARVVAAAHAEHGAPLLYFNGRYQFLAAHD